VIADGPQGPPDNTVLYLLAAVIIAAMVLGYLVWRDRRGTRRHDIDKIDDIDKGDFS
jgi:hypothetical protein